ncbi:MAG: glycosyltransferase family 8 protein [Lachnospira sp.]
MMNIVVSLNSKYIKAAKTMLFSLHKYTKEPITVWLLNHSLSDYEVQRFKSFLRKYSIDFAVIPIGTSFFDDMPLVSENLFSIEMYYRIFIPWLLPEIVERALWLDSDIIILGDVAQFYNLDLSEHCIAACEDGRYINASIRGQDNDRLGLESSHRYFNSGVLLMNLNLIRRSFSQEEVCTLAGRIREKLVYPDQDILNCLYQNSVMYADYHLYNCGVDRIHLLTDEEKSNIRILHYYGINKPWDLIRGYDPEKLYWKTQREMGNPTTIPHIIFYLRSKLSRIVWLRKLYYSMTGIRK